MTLSPGQAPLSLNAPNDLKRLIRRRRRTDTAFALAGVLFVWTCLAVLALLLGQLVLDGSEKLTGGHEVKPDGYAPGMRELVGSLRPADPVQSKTWVLQRDPVSILNAESLLGSERLRSLVSNPVFAKGELPQPGHLEMEISSLEAADAAPSDKFSRDGIVGTLENHGGRWVVVPSGIPLDLSDLETNPARLSGKRVAVDPGISRKFPLKPRGVEPLVFQSFFGSMPSREASRAGVKSALVGSFLVVLVTMILAVPLGIGAGVFLEEYGHKNWFTALIEINIANLAGVPSIVWGLMSLGLLVYGLGLGRSILTGGITLGLLVLPIVITATREAIRAIPQHVREASYACGASKWQTIQHHVLPYSLSGILTGTIIGLSRAIGETAPLITIGALTYVAFLPEFSWSRPFAWLESSFTVLPIQMFNWISRPDRSFQANAAAGGTILLTLTLCMNAVAIVLRYRLRKRVTW